MSLAGPPGMNISIPQSVVRPVRSALAFPHLVTGRWFHELLQEYLRRFESRPLAAEAPVTAETLRKAEEIIRGTCIKAAVIGTGAATVNTGAGLWSAQTGGLALFAAVPAAGLALVGDLFVRALLHIDMTCRIADLFAIRFSPEDPADLAHLYAVGVRAIESPEEGEGRGREMLERIAPLHSEDAARAVGSVFGNETLLRNVVPVVGILGSGAVSWRMTRHLGDLSLSYARSRRALAEATGPIAEKAPEAVDLLIEGIWFVFTSDGRLDAHEAAILSHLIHRGPARAREDMLRRFTDDETGWVERLREVPSSVRAPFLDALYVAAALDTEVVGPEKELLARVARTLEQEAEPERVETMASRLRASGVTV